MLRRCSGGASQLARNCHLAGALVRDAQKSRCVSTAIGFLVSTTDVKDVFADENSVAMTVRGYCSVDNLSLIHISEPTRPEPI
eukprot:6096970-Pyramimonas_sp.AAC.1